MEKKKSDRKIPKFAFVVIGIVLISVGLIISWSSEPAQIESKEAKINDMVPGGIVFADDIRAFSVQEKKKVKATNEGDVVVELNEKTKGSKEIFLKSDLSKLEESALEIYPDSEVTLKSAGCKKVGKLDDGKMGCASIVCLIFENDNGKTHCTGFNQTFSNHEPLKINSNAKTKDKKIILKNEISKLKLNKGKTEFSIVNSTGDAMNYEIKGNTVEVFFTILESGGNTFELYYE